MSKKITLALIGWAITVVLFYILLRNINYSSFINQLTHINLFWLTLAILLNLVVVLLKSTRWQLITTKNQRAPFKLTNEATFIGMAGNNLLPARAGDVMKIFLMCKWSKMPKLGLLFIVGLERFFDGITLFIVAYYTLLTIALPTWVGTGLKSLLLVLTIGIIFCLIIMFGSNWKALPKKIQSIVANISTGLQMLKNWKQISQVTIVSILSTTLQILTLVLCQKALGIELPLVAPALVFLAINLAIMIPSAPSNLGPFEFAAVLAYAVIGVNKESALNIALIFHALQIIPVTLIGLFFIAKNNLKFGQTKPVQPKIAADLSKS